MVSRPAGGLEELLERINDGRAAETLPEIERLLLQQPGHPAAMALRAEALRLAGRQPEAIEAYRRAGELGAGARNWLVAGVMLAAERKTDEALKCLHNALAQSPDDEQVLDTLITTLFNANRHREAIEFARHQLTIGTNPKFLANAALLLQSSDCYEEACNAFKRIVQLAPDDPALIGAALATARFTCEWDWIESLQRQINAWYDQGDFAAPQEYPLTHLTWCLDEARNLAVTRAYVERTLVRAQPRAWDLPSPPRQRIRVGYLSCDFRNHATMHLMAGLLEAHNRERFEIFAYDYSSQDLSDYRQRFLEAVEHHIEIHSLSDPQAAERIAQDQLDILFDLKVYTGGCRPGILALRPAPLQAAYLGFPGSAANADIDYIVSDRFVTPDSSSPYYSEHFCRLPHTYQCNDRRRPAAAEPGSRAMHGLPEDGIVFGAFNQSYKVDRTSFTVWLRVLQEVPGSVLWLLGQNNAAIAHLSNQATLAGIDPGRLVFAPFAQPREHLARLQLADAILDTLACNGHTTTSDALWAGAPVITARGKHFASRVSESLLHAMALPELVGSDHEDMVRIAKRIGTDADYRVALRRRVLANRANSPLFDTARFTRDFEAAIQLMVRQQRSGLQPTHIDVPDAGPVAAAPLPAPSHVPAVAAAALQTAYRACPLCASGSVTLGFAHPASSGAQPPWPTSIEWMRCPACGHVHNRHHLTEAGEAAALCAPHARTAARLAPMVEKTLALLGGYRSIAAREARPLWVDIDCGDGALLMAAADYGFTAVGLDRRIDTVATLQRLGLNALLHDFLKLKFEVTLDVLSMLNVLDRVPYPAEALQKAARVLRSGGALVISVPDLSSSGWRALDAGQANPHWSQIERCHLFSRDRLIALLTASDFEVADFAIPESPQAQMELYCIRQ